MNKKPRNRFYPGLAHRGDGTLLIHTRARRYHVQLDPFRVLDISGEGIRAVTPWLLLDRGLLHLRQRSPLSEPCRVLQSHRWLQDRTSSERPVMDNWVQLPEEFLSRIPDPWRQRVASMPAQHCRLLRTLTIQGAPFFELLMHAPAIALLLACPGVVGRPHRNMQQWVRRWLRRPRREIVSQALGFGPGMTQLLSSLQAPACSTQFLRILFELSQQNSASDLCVLKRIRHAARDLHQGWVLPLMTAWNKNGLFTEPVVWQAFHADSTAGALFNYASLRILLDDKRDYMVAPPSLLPNGITALSTFLAASEQSGTKLLLTRFGQPTNSARRRVRYRPPHIRISDLPPLPPQPLPGTPWIKHLATTEEVIAEAKVLENCCQNPATLLTYLQRMQEAAMRKLSS
ncbi:MAG: hypothetical protein EA401_06060, partial [Planctomycetota bacterium]